MNLRFVTSLALLSTLASSLACSAGGGGGSKNQPGSGSTSSTGTGGTQPMLNTGGGPTITVGGATGVRDPNDKRDLEARPATNCDANGQNCTCLRLGLLGTLDSSAASKDTKPFIDWLNGKSGGTATVAMVATQPAALNAAFLAAYDILVVANVNGWTFSADDKAAVKTWVAGGGGIVTLTGFTSVATEAAATSQLVDFAGMGYTGAAMGDWTAPPTGNTTPIFYKTGTTDMRNCLNLWSNADDREASQTTAVKFTPQAAPLDKLTASLDYVGAYIGWPVKAPAGSTVLATDPMSKSNMAVALEVEGKGRIVSFGDEWVIFTNQWTPVGMPVNMNMDAGNMCWQPPVGTDAGFFQSVRTLYQTKQFWYNMISWVAPPSQCNFKIDDPEVIVK